ncbi:hypothetical protein Aduo_008844 [Ancylostoma duodenale]
MTPLNLTVHLTKGAFGDTGRIRAVAKRFSVYRERLHCADLTSVTKRIGRDDGIRFHASAKEDNGDGFMLVIITPMQSQCLHEFAVRGIGIDDTFDVSQYKLRLATIAVADQFDRALSAGYYTNYRMTREEVEVLFEQLQKVVPEFDTRFFMSDDSPAFWNAFKSVFPNTTAKKYYAVGKRSKRWSARSAASWDGRMMQWASFGRHRSVMNTSLLCERWHRRLKRDVLGSRRKIRLDTLMEVLIDVTCDIWDEFVMGGNHCRKDAFGACGYAFSCDCIMDSSAGVSCILHMACMMGASLGSHVTEDNEQIENVHVSIIRGVDTELDPVPALRDRGYDLIQQIVMVTFPSPFQVYLLKRLQIGRHTWRLTQTPSP